ncbi:Os02g0542901 [Oryza sativa Japonica Group]|uniref:Os02g0542901 protein n=1 Tax=Oryza sativa subsp. japonica TaxID=39947 RepID=A0A0P0VK62_ORYSJ|nr:Os02g0542901 [Oryza sativa Japonica Group]
MSPASTLGCSRCKGVVDEDGNGMSTIIIATLTNDLPWEVFLLLPTGTNLVRSFLVCRPFLRVAFLHRFHQLHDPLLLDCLVHHPSHTDQPASMLVPFSPAATIVTRAGDVWDGDFSLCFLLRDGWLATVALAPWQLSDCHNGHVLITGARHRRPIGSPPPIAQLRHRGEEGGRRHWTLYLLTMRGFCVEEWACAEGRHRLHADMECGWSSSISFLLVSRRRRCTASSTTATFLANSGGWDLGALLRPLLWTAIVLLTTQRQLLSSSYWGGGGVKR